MVLDSRRPSNQFLVDGVANLDGCNFDGRWRRRLFESGFGNKRESRVVVDIAAIARDALGAVADPHADGGLFVGGVTAPVGFPANAAWSVFGNSTKAVDRNSLSLRKVYDPALIGIGNIY